MVRPFKIEVKPKYATFFYAGNGTMSTHVVTFADIDTVVLLYSEKWKQYDVEARNSVGDAVIRYTAPSEASAKEFINVLTAISKPTNSSADMAGVKTL